MLPKEDPELRRAALLRRRAPRRQMLATESKIPAASPGKKPTRTAPTGKLSQLWANGIAKLLGVGVEDCVAGVGDVVGLKVDEERGEEDVVGDGDGVAGALD